MMDSFKCKNSVAWDEFSSIYNPKIFQKGDEVNELISTADIIAFLTDVKLYKDFLPLNYENIETVWAPYEFNTTCRYLDERSVPKIKWYNDELIDIGPYIAKPTIFLLVDEIDKMGLDTEQIDISQTTLGELGDIKPKKFRKVIQRLKPYNEILNKAHELGGCVQFFDKHQDSDKIRDGDILAYMGEHSKRIAKTYEDAWDVTVIRVKDIKKIKKKKQ